MKNSSWAKPIAPIHHTVSLFLWIIELLIFLVAFYQIRVHSDEGLQLLIGISASAFELIFICYHSIYFREHLSVPSTREEAAERVLDAHLAPYENRGGFGGIALSIFGAASDPYLYMQGAIHDLRAEIATLHSRHAIPGPQSGALIRMAIQSGNRRIEMQPASYCGRRFPCIVNDAEVCDGECRGMARLESVRFGPFEFDVRFNDAEGVWIIALRKSTIPERAASFKPKEISPARVFIASDSSFLARFWSK